MSDDSSRCPTPEQIAAFVAGSLDGDELMMVAEHIRTCGDCRMVLAEAARVDREEGDPATSPDTDEGKRSRRIAPWWLAAAAAALAGIAWLAGWPAHLGERNEAIERLVEAAPADGRYLEPRVTGGFAWAPMRPVRRADSEPLEPAQMKLVGVAGEILEATARDASPESQHAAAVAHLLAGRPSQAALLLAKLAASHDDAQVWSDLAAARYVIGVQSNQPAQFAEALAAADAALRREPRLTEAMFNRALIIERLGLRDRAREAWKAYLATDPGSAWSAEARRRLAELKPRADFREEFERTYEKLLGDEEAARELVVRHPQEARVWGETQVLARWAEASLRGDEPAAALHLRLARTFGHELARSRGDRMLLDAVVAIETASPDLQRVLAGGHLQFRSAQKLYGAGRASDAGPLFDKAAAAFEHGQSPAAMLASYFSANTHFDRGRIDGAHDRLARLLASAPSHYPAHRAQLLWEMGLVRAATGRWGAAIDAFDESIATFERLGEKRYAATVRQILAEVYDRVGDFRTGWTQRHAALQELGASEDKRTQIAVQAAARAAALEHNWPVSLALADLVVDMPRADATKLFRIETFLFRAGVHDRLGRSDAATTDLTTATKMIATLEDQSAREHAEAARDALAGFLAASPAQAVTSLTRAIEYHRFKGRRMFLPELHLRRGRALVAMGNMDAGAADFENGIVEIETQRLSLDAGAARWGIFNSSGELFDDAISLCLSRADDVAAFGYSERARAREVLDAIGIDAATTNWATPAKMLPRSDAVVIEYAALPATLVAFVIDRGELSVVQTPVSRAALLHESDRLIESAIARDTAGFRRIAASLYGRLLAPVADAFRDGRPVVFVPDATLSTVPFAALVDADGRYVVERNSVTVTPSAAVYARLAARRRDARRDVRLLIMSGATGTEGDVRQLTSAQREADAVAAAYREPAVIVASRSTDRVGFEERSAAADVIHFVGHAEVPDAGSDAALVVAGSSGRYDVRSIASLRLLRTRAVILAACATARGERRRGEAGVSIARAFLAAGAPSVVATLWPIEDGPASEFFPRVHHHLADGLSPAEAVRATQIEWIQRRDVSPALWAAVQVIGS